MVDLNSNILVNALKLIGQLLQVKNKDFRLDFKMKIWAVNKRRLKCKVILKNKNKKLVLCKY